MRKLIRIVLLALIMMPLTPVCASDIDIFDSVGGFGYYMDQYVKNGGDLKDCIPYAYRISEEEKQVLYRIVEAEVTDEGNEKYLDAKKNVASCILTRLDNGWGNSVSEVVFAPKQFSPISDGRYYTVNITRQTIEAVEWVLRYGKTHDAEYFCTRTCESYKSGYHSTLTKLFDDVVHSYFKEEKQ